MGLALPRTRGGERPLAGLARRTPGCSGVVYGIFREFSYLFLRVSLEAYTSRGYRYPFSDQSEFAKKVIPYPLGNTTLLCADYLVTDKTPSFSTTSCTTSSDPVSSP